jgi:ABC-type Fe3+-hydroxamate transport system substrate-binding protein
MPTVIDQMGRRVDVPLHPQRIVSLVPSQTELLFDLGLGPEIVGRTRYCIHPADRVQSVEVVGGTKTFDLDRLIHLRPDLIIGNKEENDQDRIDQLAAAYPVWLSDIATLGEALAMIRQVGRLVDRADQADVLAGAIEDRFAHLPRLPRPWRVAYVIWQRPTMVAGPATFIDDMLSRCGFENAFAMPGGPGGRYPELTDADLHAADLDAILLASEPFPFVEAHRQAFLARFPGTRVELVDGEMFSWYGSRLLLAAAHCAELVRSLA